MNKVFLIAFAFLAGWSARAADIKPHEYVALQTPPVFAAGHALPRLNRWGYLLSSNVQIALARDWGYTLEMGFASSNFLTAPASGSYSIYNTNSSAYRYLGLANSEPDVYKLAVLFYHKDLTDRTVYFPPAFYSTNSSGEFLNSLGNVVTNGTLVSPQGPDSMWEDLTEHWIYPLRVLRSNAPIAYVFSDAAEHGMTSWGHGKLAWRQDPRDIEGTNGLTGPRYSALRKAHQIGFVTRAVEELLPDRELYIFYNTTAESQRMGPTWAAEWGWDSDVLNTNTDLPSFESYYTGAGAGHDFTNVSVNNSDLLTKYLNSVAWNHTLGYKTNYSWVCGGQSADPTKITTIPRYTGFLKCLYTGGMIGGIANYSFEPAGGMDASFAPDNPPNWLEQMLAMSRVHAQFTHLQEYLFDGELLPSPARHTMSTDLFRYEFTNTVADATARVLARKHNDREEWLITAWAAGGDARDVTVTIPDLGDVTVNASDSGNIYRATVATGPLLLDATGQYVGRKVGRADKLRVRRD